MIGDLQHLVSHPYYSNLLQFYVNPVSAVTMLHEVAVPAGEWPLQTAASSVLGRMMISIAKHEGLDGCGCHHCHVL